MADLSQQGMSDVAATAGQEAPRGGFDKTNPSTEDAERIIFGSACGGVNVNNKEKVRRYWAHSLLCRKYLATQPLAAPAAATQPSARL
jgi:hypothetical protein